MLWYNCWVNSWSSWISGHSVTPNNGIGRKLRELIWLLPNCLFAQQKHITCTVPIYFSVSYSKLSRKWVAGMSPYMVVSVKLYLQVGGTSRQSVLLEMNFTFFKYFLLWNIYLNPCFLKSIVNYIVNNNYDHKAVTHFEKGFLFGVGVKCIYKSVKCMRGGLKVVCKC